MKDLKKTLEALAGGEWDSVGSWWQYTRTANGEEVPAVGAAGRDWAWLAQKEGGDLATGHSTLSMEDLDTVLMIARLGELAGRDFANSLIQDYYKSGDKAVLSGFRSYASVMMDGALTENCQAAAGNAEELGRLGAALEALA